MRGIVTRARSAIAVRRAVRQLRRRTLGGGRADAYTRAASALSCEPRSRALLAESRQAGPWCRARRIAKPARRARAIAEARALRVAEPQARAFRGRVCEAHGRRQAHFFLDAFAFSRI